MSRARRHFRTWTWARRLTALTFIVLLYLAGKPYFPWFNGSITGTRLLDTIAFTDPLAAIEITLASRKLHGTLLLGAATLAAGALLLGPLFCGWVCPLGFALELNNGVRARLQRWLRRAGRRLPEWRLPRGLRYTALGAAIGASVLTAAPVFQTLSPINALGWLLSHQLLTGLLIVVAILGLVEWLAPRLWCRSLCPAGALYSLLGRWAPLRVRVNLAEAGKIPCRRCTLHCPMGIRVMEDYTLRLRPSVSDPECTRCGACADTCPRDVLWLGFRRLRPPPRPPHACAPEGNGCDAFGHVELPLLQPPALCGAANEPRNPAQESRPWPRSAIHSEIHEQK